MRLFVAIPVPQRVAQALLHHARGLEPGGAAARAAKPREAGEFGKAAKWPRWTSPENMHLTLVFLGEVAEEKLAAIAAELEALNVPNLNLRVTGLGTFPRAGVFFAEIEPAPALLKLQAEVSQRMARAGLVPPAEDQGRPYHPHLTLARTRSPIRLKPAQLKLPHSVPRLFSADEVILYRSHSTPAGSRYEPLIRRVSNPM